MNQEKNRREHYNTGRKSCNYSAENLNEYMQNKEKDAYER